jgi:hypothetical protein
MAFQTGLHRRPSYCFAVDPLSVNDCVVALHTLDSSLIEVFIVSYYKVSWRGNGSRFQIHMTAPADFIIDMFFNLYGFFVIIGDVPVEVGKFVWHAQYRP